MPLPRISIALATYNGARYLREQLISIAEQTLLPHELVVSDDASSDETVEVVEEFKRNAPFIVELYCNPRRLGYSSNFERALERCSGRIVFFCDQDDVWMSHKIERVMSVFASNPEKLLVVHDRLSVGHELNGRGHSTLEAIWRLRLDPTAYVAGSATAIRSELVRLALPFPAVEGIGHDVWIHNLARLLDASLVIGDPLMLYRRHDSNVSNRSSEPSQFRLPAFWRLRRTVRAFSRAISGHRTERLRANAELHLELADRLSESGKAADGRFNVPSAIRRSELDAEHGRMRLAALEMPLLQRPSALLRLAQSGAYGKPVAMNTLVLDLFSLHRPQSP